MQEEINSFFITSSQSHSEKSKEENQYFLKLR